MNTERKLYVPLSQIAFNMVLKFLEENTLYKPHAQIISMRPLAGDDRIFTSALSNTYFSLTCAEMPDWYPHVLLCSDEMADEVLAYAGYAIHHIVSLPERDKGIGIVKSITTRKEYNAMDTTTPANNTQPAVLQTETVESLQNKVDELNKLSDFLIKTIYLLDKTDYSKLEDKAVTEPRKWSVTTKAGTFDFHKPLLLSITIEQNMFVIQIPEVAFILHQASLKGFGDDLIESFCQYHKNVTDKVSPFDSPDMDYLREKLAAIATRR